MKTKLLAQNKKAHFEYFIEDTMEAGIVLLGSEVKALRQGKVNIEDSYGANISNELFLMNMHIGHYDKAGKMNHEPKRQRKLLLHGKQINKIFGKIKLPGYSLVPLSAYFNPHNKVKIEIAIVKGKQLHDKRESIKNKDWQREQQKIMHSKRSG